MKISDGHYRSKLPFRARGLAEMSARIGDVCADIDARLERKPVVRVLDLGCGYGTVLLELRQRYGARVDLHGLNRQPRDGDLEILMRNGIERGLIAESVPAEPPLPPLPVIHHADAGTGLPFADGSFDLVVSQVAWLYFGNKIAVLREVSRILRDDGVARIDADEVHPALPAEYARLVEIREHGRLVPLGEYLGRYGGAFVPAAEGEYLRFGKLVHFAEDLEPVFEVDTNVIHAHWNGIKCVYRVLHRPPAGSET
jgi:SAM-dependent methyltransferase